MINDRIILVTYEIQENKIKVFQGKKCKQYSN